MKLYAPKYYTAFACTAGACRHSCCIGWEIDIDEDTYAYYQGIEGLFGKRLKACIAEEDGTAHFVLGANERCPFLNQSGLCDIYTELGEGALCQICTDHPRYRNFYEDRIEIGLGLCCEAAARLILTDAEKMEMVLLSEEGEAVPPDAQELRFLEFRARVLSILQDRTLCIDARIQKLCAEFSLYLPQKSYSEWARIYMAFEQLDAGWTRRLSEHTKNDYMPSDLMREQLLCYFICRHTPDGIFDGSLLSRVAFAISATQLICELAEDDEDFLEVARMYSAEIEYAEENMQALLELM